MSADLDLYNLLINSSLMSFCPDEILENRRITNKTGSFLIMFLPHKNNRGEPELPLYWQTNSIKYNNYYNSLIQII
jgi:hypothetical protein